MKRLYKGQCMLDPEKAVKDTEDRFVIMYDGEPKKVSNKEYEFDIHAESMAEAHAKALEITGKTQGLVQIKIVGEFTHEEEVVANKQLRKDLDEKIQALKNLPPSRERSIAITKLQESVMWLGMDLKRLNEPNPYPTSKDPSTGDKLEPTADGLKL